jgi:hypothetical protein
MGWQWKKKYGVDVIQTVCKAIGRDSPSIIASRGQLASLPTSSPHNALSSSVSASFGSTVSTDLLAFLDKGKVEETAFQTNPQRPMIATMWPTEDLFILIPHCQSLAVLNVIQLPVTRPFNHSSKWASSLNDWKRRKVSSK